MTPVPASHRPRPTHVAAAVLAAYIREVRS
jgi:hypothetical protein